MKARVLKRLLLDTGYIVHNDDEAVLVGSPMCSDLISVNKKTLNIKYALDTFREGRKALVKDSKKELLFIWDKLLELIESGELQDIINGDDEIENPLPVYTVDDGILIETFTDKYGWPNVTISGKLMHDNNYFKTKGAAIEYGIKDLGYGIDSLERMVKEKEQELANIRENLETYIRHQKYLKELLNQYF